MCCSVFNVWLKTTLLLPVWPREPKGWTPLPWLYLEEHSWRRAREGSSKVKGSEQGPSCPGLSVELHPEVRKNIDLPTTNRLDQKAIRKIQLLKTR